MASRPALRTRAYSESITACRHDKLTAHLRAAGLGAIADLGFVDSTMPVRTPTRL
ncbi:hypothetical protein [Streptomyces sp. NPDC096132]|uniref:hypothetical protein n=1 Tax=Streptomyces sp. NPDC096132 TaxID=3366075 RepID=UPI00381C76E5